MKIVGLCRFSYAAVGGFKRMHDSVAAREAYLYDPARMDLRFRHFETLTLPSVAAQRDPGFNFVILTGDGLPRRWRERLHDMTAGVPQVRIVTMPPMKHRLAAQRAIKAALDEDDTDSLQFRLDDDDALAVNFTRAIRRMARRTARLASGWRNLAFEFSSGYSVRLGPEGIAARRQQGGFWACGLAVLFRPGDPKTVMNYGHHRLHHIMPTLIEPTSEMYLRAHHSDNDSGAGPADAAFEPLSPEGEALFRDRFNVDADRVRSAFSAPPADAAEPALRGRG